MKNIIENFNIVLYLIIICMVITLIGSTKSFSFPTALTLSDGNVLIIDEFGIYIYDSSLTNIISTEHIFIEEDQIKTKEDLSNVILRRYKGYILSLVNYKFYFFNDKGKLLFHNSTKFVDSSYPESYALIPIIVNNDIYYYIIGYFDTSNYLNFLYYKYDIIYNTSTLIMSKIDEKYKKRYYDNGYYYYTYDFKNNGLSCDYLADIYYTQSFALACFFVVSSGYYEYLTVGFYDISDSTIENIYSYEIDSINYQNIRYIKSESNYNIKRALICVVMNDNKAYCHKFYIDSSQGIFYKTIDFKKECRNETYGMKVTYLYETQEVTFSCISTNGSIQAAFFDIDLTTPDSSIKQFNFCQTIYAHSILYITDYFVLSDVKCNGNSYPFINLMSSSDEILGQSDENDDNNDIETIITIKEEEEEKESDIYSEITEVPIMECQGLEKCSQCNKESFDKNLCIKCNNKKGYYPLYSYTQSKNNQYIECVNDFTKPRNFYFNIQNKDYESCYDTCATCDYKGDGNENNCTSCDDNYIKKPDYEDSTNCVLKCNYYYYYTTYGQYKCTSLTCPKSYSLLIKNKDKCVENCTNDNIYKYQYNGECLKECPSDTNDNNDYLCKDINKNKCLLTENEFNSLSDDFTDEDIENLAFKYAQEFKYTDNHISVYKNRIYTITFYKNGDCISDLSLQIPEIDFGECYKKIQNNYKIEDNLVIAIVDKKTEGLSYHKMISYTIFDPKEGEKIYVDDLCKDDKLIMQQNIIDKLNDSDIDIDSLLFLTEQNIDVFNLSSAFYTDICYQYHSEIDKDVALKDRILIYFPNITFCEEECEIIGVNISTLKAMCQCSFNNKDKKTINDNIIYYSQIGQIEEMISSTNIIIIKCFKEVFNSNYFKSCVGGFIILGIIFAQIIFTIAYCSNSLYYIRKYIFSITNLYLSHLSSLNNNNNSLSNHSLSIVDNNLSKKNEISLKKDERQEGNLNLEGRVGIKRLKKKGKTSISRKINFSFKNIENKMNSNKNINLVLSNDNLNDNNNNNNNSNNNYYNNSINDNTNKSNNDNINNTNKSNNNNISNNDNINNDNINNSNINNNISNNGNVSNNENVPKNQENILILSNNSFNNSIENKPKMKRRKKRGSSFVKSKKFNIDLSKDKKISLDDIPYLSNDPINKYKLSDETVNQNYFFMNIKSNLNINIEDYLKTEVDEMDYYDAIKKDKRAFCEYYRDKLKTNQIILNAFYFKEPLKPRAIKILLFILQIDLYFFVNGLFFNEEYVSQIFHLENDTFYDTFQRFLGNCFYSALVGVIVNYIIECFFIDEIKIKGILKREKENLFILKYEIVQIAKDIKHRYIYYIVISFIITIFSWYHISCFNVIYPHMKKEWIIFSIIIIFFMQLLSLLVCLLQSIIRFLSFKCKSEKIYKIGLLLA